MSDAKELEQYLFHADCLAAVADLVGRYERPCCLCTPTVGRALAERGRQARVLDIDTRFSDIPGFHHFDLYAPEYLDEEYDFLVCDAPFLSLPLPRMFEVVRTLSRDNFALPMLVTFPAERGAEIVAAFEPFGLKATGYYPPYEIDARQRFVEFFTNLPPERHNLRNEA